MEKTIEYNKKTVTILLHIFQNFIDSHTTPIQLFFHTSLLFWNSHKSNSIRNFIIIPYLFFIITILIKRTPLLLILCYIFITYTDTPFSLLLIDWHKWWILATKLLLKANSITKAHLNLLNFLSTSNCWFPLLISVSE